MVAAKSKEPFQSELDFPAFGFEKMNKGGMNKK